MKRILNFLMIFSLLLGLVFSGPARTVLAQEVITIGPDALATAIYTTKYSQQLTVDGGNAPYIFSLLEGSLPNGITLSGTGLLSGFPEETLPGEYPITVHVQDANGNTAKRAYTFELDKGTPTVKLYTGIFTWNYPFNLSAEVGKETGYSWFYVLDGTVAFSIGGSPVPGCEKVLRVGTTYSCSGASMDLSVDTKYIVEAAYTPTAEYAKYYYPATGSREITVETNYVNIYGIIFEDKDRNGTKDSNEYGLQNWMVKLDKGCDNTVDETAFTIYNGYYNFSSLHTGYQYCISADAKPSWQQTTTSLAPFVLKDHTFSLNIGFYYPTITLSPSGYELPDGELGLEYNQVLVASGGTEPYTYKISAGTLPAGLSLSSEGVLSGTPTDSGQSEFTVQAEDATHAVGEHSYILGILTNGVFTLISSSNPSAPGEAVTFTLSATGDAVLPYLDQIPPIGFVTFLADENPIEGCSDLLLNYDRSIGSFGDYPASCTTTALVIGSHIIKAVYTDSTYLYKDAIETLTQEVQASVVTADLSINKTDSKDLVKPGAKLLYTLEVRNAGPDAAQTITLFDNLDRNTTYVSTTAPKGWTCTYSNGKVACTSAGLASGSSATIKITVTVNKTVTVGKDLVNTASVSSETNDPDLSNNSVTQKTMVTK